MSTSKNLVPSYYCLYCLFKKLEIRAKYFLPCIEELVVEGEGGVGG
jgi:hypothetical protein